MKSYSVIGLFCEDIRREETGQDTIIGMLPDTIRVNQLPGVFPKLAIYVRALFNVSYNLKNLSYNIIGPDNALIQSIEVEDNVTNSAFARAKENGNPLVGFRTLSTFSPVRLPQEGRFQIHATVNRTTFLCGFLKVELAGSEEDKTDS